MGAQLTESDPRDRLRSISRALQELHRTLLQYQRRDYEKHFGRIGSDFYVLQLAAEDPQFAWLRALSAEMLRIDEMVSGKDAIDPAELQLTGTRLRYLLNPSADGNSFQSHYDRAMQVTPDIIMAHAAAMRSLPPARDVTLFRSDPPAEAQAHTAIHHPGSIVPGHGDHGYRALAAVSFGQLDQESSRTAITAANEDVILLVSDGSVQFLDAGAHSLTLDASHPLILNAGTGFEYDLSVPPGGAPAHVVQAHIRPSSLGGDPVVQHGEIPAPDIGRWRSIAGPEDSDAPFHVRNSVEACDITAPTGADVVLPSRDAWDVFFLVTEGRVEIDGVAFPASGAGMVIAPDNVRLTVLEDAQLVAFTIDRRATITRAGRTAR